MNLIDTGIFLCLAFEEPGFEECGHLLDRADFGDFRVLLSSMQFTEIHTAFLRVEDAAGSREIAETIWNMRPRVRDLDVEVAKTAAELRSTVKTPGGRWLALADSVILSTALQEGANVVYTIDPDFIDVKQVRVMAPEMELREWIANYGTRKQRKRIGLK